MHITQKTTTIQFRLRNDLYCVEWGVKLYSLTHSLTTIQSNTKQDKLKDVINFSTKYKKTEENNWNNIKNN